MIAYLENYRKVAKVALQNSRRFEPPTPIAHMAEYASPIVSCGNQTGEGWFLTGEMIELIKSGVSNIVCAQPLDVFQIMLSEKVLSKSLDDNMSTRTLLPLIMIRVQVKSTS